jgi:hypothetical protein
MGGGFVFLKNLPKDEAEIQELRMGQLMERIRNGEEIIDEKTRECEEQKVIIRELRKESAQLRARLDAERSRSRSSSMSSEVLITRNVLLLLLLFLHFAGKLECGSVCQAIAVHGRFGQIFKAIKLSKFEKKNQKSLELVNVSFC